MLALIPRKACGDRWEPTPDSRLLYPGWFGMACFGTRTNSSSSSARSGSGSKPRNRHRQLIPQVLQLRLMQLCNLLHESGSFFQQMNLDVTAVKLMSTALHQSRFHTAVNQRHGSMMFRL